MKRIASIVAFFLSVVFASAQFSSSGKMYQQITPANDTVLVFIFNGITSTSDITYSGTFATVNWFKYSDLTSSISNQSSLSPDDATGYVAIVDGKKYTIWAIDYKNYLPDLISIKPDESSPNPCEMLSLLIEANVTKKLSYKTLSNATYDLPRNFTVKYATQKWENSKWAVDSLSYPVSINSSITHLAVKAPFIDTKFVITGDQYAADFGLNLSSKTSIIYSAVAVECHLTSVVTERKETNEASKPEDKTPINYSAPIEIQFLSNANEPVAKYYTWEIIKGKEPIIKRTDKDQRYTFSEFGTYRVKVTAGEGHCSYVDSITINVSESALQVPNVFTPNGDGMNDEFRVGYKSIVSFQCWVYNRWGRQVFYWNDPQKGWDGRINGKNAPEGPYFYVIKAYGSDYDLTSKPDPKTRLRIGEHPRKGDINLLRGTGK